MKYSLALPMILGAVLSITGTTNAAPVRGTSGMHPMYEIVKLPGPVVVTDGTPMPVIPTEEQIEQLAPGPGLMIPTHDMDFEKVEGRGLPSIADINEAPLPVICDPRTESPYCRKRDDDHRIVDKPVDLSKIPGVHPVGNQKRDDDHKVVGGPVDPSTFPVISGPEAEANAISQASRYQKERKTGLRNAYSEVMCREPDLQSMRELRQKVYRQYYLDRATGLEQSYLLDDPRRCCAHDEFCFDRAGGESKFRALIL
ncbi:hypothetical protein OHC33_005948 [Knufia fluminis]|uniref:Uncharacterized protein n=1 Tax=Knufia fluminis TaxID=191047 RepID=A0AAN8ED61_9EURO|nr:hypothetical protein OHC33_005948 [Knufia fluminis]